MGARRALLDPAHMQVARSKVHLLPAQVHKLRDPQAVTIGDQEHRSVPMAPTVSLHGGQKPLDLGLSQVLSGSQVRVG